MECDTQHMIIFTKISIYTTHDHIHKNKHINNNAASSSSNLDKKNKKKIP